MSRRWSPWLQLLPVWLPAVLLFVLSLALYLWQTSGSMGREVSLAGDVEELRATLVRLEKIGSDATREAVAVEALSRELERIESEVFGSLADRLTGILRAVDNASREAGLRPERYRYTATEEAALDLIRFGVVFDVEGRYPQIRQMLATIQSSPQFLIIERLDFSGEREARNLNLKLSISLATYVAEADREELQRLLESASAMEAGDGPQ